MAFLATSTGLAPQQKEQTQYPPPSIGPSNPNVNYNSAGSSPTPGIGGGSFPGGISPSSGGSGRGLGVDTQASDYDNIMKSYRDLLSGGGVTANITPYQQSVDSQRALSKLDSLSSNGGYSDQDIQDIRERSVSPIRSIYASAQQNLNRSKNLAGGYSPNSAAAIAKMARESSSQIGDITTNVNAGIAQNRAANKLSIAPSYASASQNENQARTQVEQHNADTINQINQFNQGLKLSSLEGMKGLYGTTPALIKTFGDQALQSRSLDQNQQQVKNQSQQALLRQLLASFGSV